MDKEKRSAHEEDAAPAKKAKGPASYKAAPGHSFPIFYKGSIIRIGDTEPVEIDVRHLGYEGSAQFQRALDKKQIVAVGA